MSNRQMSKNEKEIVLDFDTEKEDHKITNRNDDKTNTELNEVISKNRILDQRKRENSFSIKRKRHNSYINPEINLEQVDLKLNNNRVSLINSRTSKIANKSKNQFYKKAGLNLSLTEFNTPCNTSVDFNNRKHHVLTFQKEFDMKNTQSEYCDICFQDINDKFTLSCGDFFCKDCIKQHVMNCLVNAMGLRNLLCPKTICNEKIKESVLEKIMTETEWEKYQKIKLKVEELCNPLNLACPIPDCDSYGLKSNIKMGVLICLENHKFCVKCQKSSHEGAPCQPEQDPTEELLAKDKFVKKCPNCKSFVEKEEALCNNVTCANVWCNYQFCWICMSAFDKNHYSNPLSTCFGMQEVKYDSHFAKNKCLRITKCLLIFLLMIIVLPIIILLFSFVVMTFYILAFVLDGSAVKNLKLKTEIRQKIFKFFIYATYIALSIPSLTLGYWSLCILIVSSPFIYLYKKYKKILSQEEPA